MKTIAEIYEETPGLRQVTKEAVRQFRDKYLTEGTDYKKWPAPRPAVYSEEAEKKIVKWLSKPREYRYKKNNC